MDYLVIGFIVFIVIFAVFFMYYKKHEKQVLKEEEKTAKVKKGSNLQLMQIPKIPSELNSDLPFLKISTNKKTVVPNKVVLFTGDNLSGYHELLLDLLNLMPKIPVFLVTMERDIYKFEKQENIILAVYNPRSEISDILKKLRFMYYKRGITEEEYRKQLIELRTKHVESHFGSSKKDEDEHKIELSTMDIVSDVAEFRKNTVGRGIVVLTVMENILSGNKENAFKFLEHLVNFCAKNELSILLLLEKGVFDSKVVKRVRFYSDIIFETKVEGGLKYVTILTQKKIYSNQKYDHVKRNFFHIWNEITND